MPKRKRKVNTAEEQVNHLSLGIASISKALKEQYRRQRYQEWRSKATTLSRFMETVLVLLYVFAGYNDSLATTYWVNQQKKKKRPLLPTSEIRRRIEDIFLSYDDDDLSCLVDPNQTSQKYAWRRAAYFQNKMKLKRWVRTQNVQRGLAPNSRMVIREYNILRKDTPFLLLQTDHPDPATNSSSRVFLNRWRKEVRGRWKAIRVLEYVSLEDKRGKVLLQSGPNHKSIFCERRIPKKTTYEPSF